MRYLNKLELPAWFNGVPIGFDLKGIPKVIAGSFAKSIQKSFRFYVSILPDYLTFLNPKKQEMFLDIGMMPVIKSWHVKSVKIPQYQYETVTQQYGPVPRSLAIMKNDGFDVSIDFEEDEYGTIGDLVNWLQRSIVDNDGFYRSPDAYKIPLISVITETDFGLPLGVYTLHNAFYKNAEMSSLSYDSSSAVSYSITFNVDIINSFFPMAYAMNPQQSSPNAVGGILKKVSGVGGKIPK